MTPVVGAGNETGEIDVARQPGQFAIDAMLCDSTVVADGKIYMQGGGWNAITTMAFPFRQSRIGLAAVLDVPWTQTNRMHKLEITLINEDGNAVEIGMPVQDAVSGEVKRTPAIEAEFNLGRPPHIPAGDSQPLPIALNLEQLVFESPGPYAFVFTVDGSEECRLTFRVQMPPGMNLTGGR